MEVGCFITFQLNTCLNKSYQYARAQFVSDINVNKQVLCCICTVPESQFMHVSLINDQLLLLHCLYDRNSLRK